MNILKQLFKKNHHSILYVLEVTLTALSAQRVVTHYLELETEFLQLKELHAKSNETTMVFDVKLKHNKSDLVHSLLSINNVMRVSINEKKAIGSQ